MDESLPGPECVEGWLAFKERRSPSWVAATGAARPKVGWGRPVRRCGRRSLSVPGMQISGHKSWAARTTRLRRVCIEPPVAVIRKEFAYHALPQ